VRAENTTCQAGHQGTDVSKTKVTVNPANNARVKRNSPVKANITETRKSQNAKQPLVP
jgi:hypothetical protein